MKMTLISLLLAATTLQARPLNKLTAAGKIVGKLVGTGVVVILLCKSCTQPDSPIVDVPIPVERIFVREAFANHHDEIRGTIEIRGTADIIVHVEGWGDLMLDDYEITIRGNLSPGK